VAHGCVMVLVLYMVEVPTKTSLRNMEGVGSLSDTMQETMVGGIRGVSSAWRC